MARERATFARSETPILQPVARSHPRITSVSAATPKPSSSASCCSWWTRESSASTIRSANSRSASACPMRNTSPCARCARCEAGCSRRMIRPRSNRLRLKPDMTFDPRTVIGWAVKQPPYFAPGAGYRYSNTNYLLLGLIIEKRDRKQRRERNSEPPPGAFLAYSHQLSEQSGDARSLGARLRVGRQASLGGRQRHDPGVLDGRRGRDDLRHARHEAMGEALRHRQDQRPGNAARDE